MTILTEGGDILDGDILTAADGIDPEWYARRVRAALSREISRVMSSVAADADRHGFDRDSCRRLVREEIARMLVAKARDLRAYDAGKGMDRRKFRIGG